MQPRGGAGGQAGLGSPMGRYLVSRSTHHATAIATIGNAIVATSTPRTQRSGRERRPGLNRSRIRDPAPATATVCRVCSAHRAKCLQLHDAGAGRLAAACRVASAPPRATTYCWSTPSIGRPAQRQDASSWQQPTDGSDATAPGRSGASACESASYFSHVGGEALSQRSTVKLGD